MSFYCERQWPEGVARPESGGCQGSQREVGVGGAKRRFGLPILVFPRLPLDLPFLVVCFISVIFSHSLVVVSQIVDEDTFRV